MNKIRYSIVTRKRNHGMLGVYIRCEQYGRTLDINTDVHIFNDEWNDSEGLVINISVSSYTENCTDKVIGVINHTT